MIKNQRQYQITRKQLQKLNETLDVIGNGPPQTGVHPKLRKAQEDAFRIQISDLEAQLREYDQLLAAGSRPISVSSLAELPHALVKARIASGQTQRQLAEELGLKEQQIQRYEATDYQSASLSRLFQVADVLGVDVGFDVPTRTITPAAFLRYVEEVGLDKKFLTERVLPTWLSEGLATRKKTTHAERRSWVLHLAAWLSRVFGWSPTSLLAGGPLSTEVPALASARFKTASNADQRKASVYALYAHFLALLVLDAVPALRTKKIPNDPRRVRAQILARYGVLNFQSVLDFVWGLGVAVLPLRDRGAFQGACWRAGGKNIVVLKQRTNSFDRWMYDLLHELYHLAKNPDDPGLSVIEFDDMDPLRSDSEEEQEASAFAGDVLLDGRAEEVTEICVKRARGDVRYLKRVVPQVATEHNVPVGCLANYVAFRLSMQDIDWWGTASKLQTTDRSPWSIARDALLARLDLNKLNQLDRDLLFRALTDPEA